MSAQLPWRRTVLQDVPGFLAEGKKATYFVSELTGRVLVWTDSTGGWAPAGPVLAVVALENLHNWYHSDNPDALDLDAAIPELDHFPC